MSSGPPNVLLFTVDDMNGDTPGCCGGSPAATPRLDELAREGVLFRRAHVPVAVCQPSRSALMTGRWPHRNGAEGFWPIADGVPLLTDVLRAAGYHAGIIGKVEHLAPQKRFGWELAVGHADLGAGRDPARYAEATRAFLRANGDEPWFLMANAHDPHRPFHGSDQERATFDDELRTAIPPPSHVFSPGDWPVGRFLPDLPEVRLEEAEYLSSCRRADDVLAAVLDVVEAEGQAGRTLVVFLSDNGMALPFAKANCYLHSTRTPLVLRWPGRLSPGTVVDEWFASGLDLLPTICEAAGVASPEGVDGRSLLPLLAGGAPGPANVFTVFHETAAGLRLEMRCLQDTDHGYLWNAWSDGTTTYRAENMSGRTWTAMVRAATDDPALRARTEHYLRRAPEELYDLAADPDCTRNLAADPAQAARLARMRADLQRWMVSTGDPLASAHAAVTASSAPA